jgi:hypothetical protein
MGQLHVYADDNSLGKNLNTIKKMTEVLLDASKEVGLEKWLSSTATRKFQVCTYMLSTYFILFNFS